MKDKVKNYLDELFPNPKCELNYNKDYELLIAVMLSAQTTDKKVNEVTPELFAVAPTPQKMLALGIDGLKEHIKVISKIENREGIDNFDKILEDVKKVSDSSKYGNSMDIRKILKNMFRIFKKTLHHAKTILKMGEEW